jgi:FHA domain-containing protein/von Willebrand factor type A domain-containing protein
MRRQATARWLAVAVVLFGLSVGSARTDTAEALVAVLLDSSGSVSARELERARQLALEVLAALPPGSEVAVFTFDDQSRLVLPRTSRADEVKRALAGARIAGRHTALNDALYDASRYLRESGAARPAILLITDGRDEQSTLNLEDGLRLAVEGRIPVFAVGVGQVEERGLRRIAKLTGGQYRAARGARGAELVSAMMALPATAQAAGAPSPGPGATPRASPPPTARTGQREEPVTQLSGTVRLAGIAVAVLVLAVLGIVLARRRSGSTAPEAAAPELASTVVARVGGTTEEYLEKTVVLREKAVLAVIRGPLAGQVFDLSPASATSLGRSKANDLVLDDVSVSSQHCRIRPEDGAFVLMDLKSTNGTFVNERRVTSHKLAEGDVIRVGEVQLQFRTDQRRG